MQCSAGGQREVQRSLLVGGSCEKGATVFRLVFGQAVVVAGGELAEPKGRVCVCEVSNVQKLPRILC